RRLHAKVPDGRIDDLVRTLRDDFKGDFINTRSYRSTDDQIGRDFERAENYLSLVGLIIVILGGIAVSSVTRVFILQKIRSIAVLKCVGARSAQIIAVYILQVMALGLAGSLLGVAMASGVIAAIHLALGGSTSLLAQAHYGVTWSAAVQGVGIGVLVSLLFSVVPLLQVRFIKPSLLLRDVGLGACFIVGVRSLQASLLGEFSVQVDAGAPDMFLLDVQKPQVDGVRAFLGDRSHGAGEFQLIPVMRARVIAVAGRETTLDSPEAVRESRMSIGREFTITYRDHLESNER